MFKSSCECKSSGFSWIVAFDSVFKAGERSRLGPNIRNQSLPTFDVLQPITNSAYVWRITALRVFSEPGPTLLALWTGRASTLNALDRACSKGNVSVDAAGAARPFVISRQLRDCRDPWKQAWFCVGVLVCLTSEVLVLAIHEQLLLISQYFFIFTF